MESLSIIQCSRFFLQDMNGSGQVFVPKGHSGLRRKPELAMALWPMSGDENEPLFMAMTGGGRVRARLSLGLVFLGPGFRRGAVGLTLPLEGEVKAIAAIFITMTDRSLQ